MFKDYSFSEFRAVSDIFPGRFGHSSPPLGVNNFGDRYWKILIFFYFYGGAERVHEDKCGERHRLHSARRLLLIREFQTAWFKKFLFMLIFTILLTSPHY